MLPTHTHTEGLFPTIRNNRTDFVLAAILLVLVAMTLWTMRAAKPPAILIDPIPLVRGSGSDSVAAERTEAVSNFEQNTRALAASDSPEAFQTLLLSFKENEPVAQRRVVPAALQGASPAVLPVLMTALTDADPGVRADAAQVLGMRHEYQAIAALTVATYDIKARVRLQAV